MDFILKQENGKERYLEYVTRLSQAFALAVPHDETLRIRDDVGFFQAVRSGLVKTTVMSGRTQEELDSAIRQIISKAMPHKNLAFELLRKLLNDEIKTMSKKNLIQSKSFADMLEKAIKRYQNKSIETAQVIEELIELSYRDRIRTGSFIMQGLG